MRFRSEIQGVALLFVFLQFARGASGCVLTPLEDSDLENALRRS